MSHPPLILASTSPRRRQLLEEMGLQFEVVPSNVDEDSIPADHPRTFANRAAYLKAMAVAAKAPEGALVLGSDTVVTLGNRLYGKPANAADAARMIRELSGQTHQVITAVAIAVAGTPRVLVDAETTQVTFRVLEHREIETYSKRSDIFDKAGAYGIQGAGGDLVSALRGDFYNVMGLPCGLVARLLKEADPGMVTRVPRVPDRWRH